jgi:hypothetical protein
MASISDAPEQWQLLKDVLPIFSSKPPAIEVDPLVRSNTAQEVLLILKSYSNSGIWLVPNILEEAQAQATPKSLRPAVMPSSTAG